MVTVATTGLDLCYETFGAPGDPPMVLIMGLGTQMIAWPDELCEDLARRGHFVVRFDNRDVGRSTHLRNVPAPDPIRVLLRRAAAPYGLGDMARDTVGLLDALGFDSAHLVGASMGGFIAQSVAINAPERVRSLGLIMTSTGSRRVGIPRPRVLAGLRRRRSPDADRESAIESVLEVFSTIGSPGYPPEPDYLRDLAGRSYDRAYDPSGYARQVAAVLTQHDRTAALRRLRVPTVVIHGTADPLVGVSGGRALAEAIPGARFVGLGGMGHSLPRPLWPTIAGELSRTARDGEAIAARSESAR